MPPKLTDILLIAMYIEIDDLLKEFELYRSNLLKAENLRHRKPTRTTGLSPSEVCTVIAGYQLSGYKNFQYYYCLFFANGRSDMFPKAPSYSRFVELITRALPCMVLWSMFKSAASQRTGTYIVDSKKLQVCHVKRTNSNKVFKGWAAKGKTSCGWFFGLKIHLVINNLGEIVKFAITPGNIADNNHELLRSLFKGLEGKCVGDKGYQTKLFEEFLNLGLHLIVKPKKNMASKLAQTEDLRLLAKRGVIESVNDILMSVCDIEHSRHRSPFNAMAHICASIVAYQHLEQKPSTNSKVRPFHNTYLRAS